MPLQNRVDPWGNLHADTSRAGTMMGNRGILHDQHRTIVRRWAGKSWVACDPSFKGIDRKPLFQVGRYSELFFLDEATAYAAGHRPCAYCHRERFNAFKHAWIDAHGAGSSPPPAGIKEIDARLHQERTSRNGEKLTYSSTLGSVPEGTIIEADGTALLLHGQKWLRWSFAGYTPAVAPPADAIVKVLTPKSIVKLYERGLRPRVHSSADAVLSV